MNIFNSCSKGEIKIINQFIDSEKHKIDDSILYRMLIAGIKGNQFESVKAILESTLEFKKTCKDTNLSKLIQCSLENEDIFRLLLSNKKILANKNQEIIGSLANYASLNGNLGIIQYLSENFNDNEFFHKRLKSGSIINNCAIKNNVNIAKYLLNHEHLKKYINIHIDDDAAFEYANRNNNLNFLNYLIFDFKIDMTKNIKSYIDLDSPAMNMFKARELSESLQNDLLNNSINPIKKTKL